jgi:DNA-binding CsgD family transcriptional regulator
MDLVYLGCTDREISEVLDISYGTVRCHTAAAYAKIGAGGRVQAAVAWALHLADEVGEWSE